MPPALQALPPRVPAPAPPPGPSWPATPAGPAAAARAGVACGADALMDRSTGGPVDEIRRAVIAETDACIGSVPLYQAALDTVRVRKKAIVDMTVDDIFAGIVKHGDDGVD